MFPRFFHSCRCSHGRLLHCADAACCRMSCCCRNFCLRLCSLCAVCCCSMFVRRAQAQNWQCSVPHAHRRFLALRSFPVDGVHCFQFIFFVSLYDSCEARWRQRTFHQHIFFVLNLARTDRLAVVFLLCLCNGISFVRLCFCVFSQARCLLKIHDAFERC